MEIIEVRVQEAVEYTPDHEAYCNPYFGCNAGCPFCYWLSIDGWENKIEARINLPEVLDAALCKGLPEKRLFMGSYCDPYMVGAEDRFGITRACLEVVIKHAIPFTLVSSVRSALILRDVELLQRVKELIIVTELCRPDQLVMLREGKESTSISIANQLAGCGFKVIATFAPFLPEIGGLDAVYTFLDPRIPIYVDALQISRGTVQEARMQTYLAQVAPRLLAHYEQYYDGGSNASFEAEMMKYCGGPRVKRFPIDEY